ncbi:MAG: TatD family hydrolase [Candidatus Geothermincolales bacterium]
MIELTDTHAHLDLLGEDLAEVVVRAKDAGVTRIVTVGIDIPSSRKALEIARMLPEVYATVGVHPHSADELDGKALDELREMATDPRVVAIGETGLDYYRDLSPRDLQKKAFLAQLELALELSLPLVVHDRDAHDDVLSILERYAPFKSGFIMHCFSGDMAIARAVIEMGGYVSVAGTVTIPNAHRLREVARDVPLERLVLETDCPFLSPHPYRGKKNYPERVRIIAEKVAELRGLTLEELRLPNPFSRMR